jgi:hypothetical protein
VWLSPVVPLCFPGVPAEAAGGGLGGDTLKSLMTENADENTKRVNRHVVAQNPKACELCWRRKLKCSGETPCSNCKKKNSVCDYDPAKRSSRPKQRRNHRDTDDDWRGKRRSKKKVAKSNLSSDSDTPILSVAVTQSLPSAATVGLPSISSSAPSVDWHPPHQYFSSPFYPYQASPFYAPGQYYYSPVQMSPSILNPNQMQNQMSNPSRTRSLGHQILNLGKPADIVVNAALTISNFAPESMGNFTTNDHGAALKALVNHEKSTSEKSSPQTVGMPNVPTEFWRCRLPPPLCNVPEAPAFRLQSVGLSTGTHNVGISSTNLVRGLVKEEPNDGLAQSEELRKRQELQSNLRVPMVEDERYFMHLFWWYQPHAVPYAHPEVIAWRDDWTFKTSWGLACLAHGCHHADSRIWSRETKSFLVAKFTLAAKQALVMELEFALNRNAPPRLDTVVGILKLLELAGDLGHGKEGEKLIQLCRMVQLRWRLDDFDAPHIVSTNANPYPHAPLYRGNVHVECELRLRCWWAMAALDRAAASMVNRELIWWRIEVNGKRLPCSDRIWGMLDISLMDRELFMAHLGRLHYQSWVDLPPGMERHAWLSRVISTICDESLWAFSLVATDLNRKSRELVDWIREYNLDPIYEPGPMSGLLQMKRDELELAYNDFWRMLPPPLAGLDQVGDGEGMVRYALSLDIPHQWAVSLPFSLVAVHLAFMVAFLPYELGMFQSDRFLLNPRFSQISERAIVITRLVIGAKSTNPKFDLIPSYATYGLMTSGCVHLAGTLFKFD